MELPVNRALKLYGRAGESAEDFALRCRTVAGERADAELATQAGQVRDQGHDAAQPARGGVRRRPGRPGPAGGPVSATTCCRRPGRSSAGCSAAGGPAAGCSARSAAPPVVPDARRPSRTRVEAAENKAARLQTDIEDLEAELAEELTEIDQRWLETAAKVETMTVSLERSDVKVTQLALGWLPVQ